MGGAHALQLLCPFFAFLVQQIVSNLLRAVVYDPIMERSLLHQPGVAVAFSRSRRLLAVLASFTVSGLLHEGLYWWVVMREGGRGGQGRGEQRRAGHARLGG